MGIHKRSSPQIVCALLKLNLAAAYEAAVTEGLRRPLLAPDRLKDEIWTLDFMADALYGGRAFRTLNVIDEGNREALGINRSGNLNPQS